MIKIEPVNTKLLKPHFHKYKRFWVIACVIVASLLLMLGGLNLYYRDKSAHGVSLGQVSLGNMNRFELERSIGQALDHLYLTVNFGETHAKLSLDDLGVTVDKESLANQALHIGKSNPLALLFGKQKLSLSNKVDHERVRQVIHKHFPKLITTPTEPRINYNKDTNKFIITNGLIGKSVDFDKLFSAIDDMLFKLQSSSFELATVNNRPTISNEQANQVANQANRTINQHITISHDGKPIWTIDPWTIAEWIKFDTVPLESNHKPKNSTTFTNSYKMILDKTAIDNFVNGSLANAINKAPVHQRDMVNESNDVLMKLRPGQNGIRANNTAYVSQMIYRHLGELRSGSIALTSQIDPFKYDNIVAKQGKWIDYNLSNYTVTLHQNHDAVWATNYTSHGKPSTPTLTGMFSVVRKVFNQCMPNPPSPQPLCNIHYATFWEASGYAFHEAYWLGPHNVHSRISHGCINMRLGDAKYIYDWSLIGTPVFVHW